MKENLTANTENQKEPFYSQTWFILLMMLCCCFPIGLFLMWKYKKFNKPARIIITALFAIAFLIALAGGGTSTTENAETTTQETTELIPSEAVSGTEDETETSVEETSVEETTVEETTVPAISEEEFKAACQEISYKTLLRNPDEYIGTKIVIIAKVQQVMQGGLFDDNEYYRVQTDSDGYELYLDDEYFMYDTRPNDDTKILQDDVLRIYAEFNGTETVTRALTGTKEDIPSINAYYIDILEE